MTLDIHDTVVEALLTKALTIDHGCRWLDKSYLYVQVAKKRRNLAPKLAGIEPGSDRTRPEKIAAALIRGLATFEFRPDAMTTARDGSKLYPTIVGIHQVRFGLEQYCNAYPDDAVLLMQGCTDSDLADRLMQFVVFGGIRI